MPAVAARSSLAQGARTHHNDYALALDTAEAMRQADVSHPQRTRTDGHDVLRVGDAGIGASNECKRSTNI